MKKYVKSILLSLFAIALAATFAFGTSASSDVTEVHEESASFSELLESNENLKSEDLEKQEEPQSLETSETKNETSLDTQLEENQLIEEPEESGNSIFYVGAGFSVAFLCGVAVFCKVYKKR